MGFRERIISRDGPAIEPDPRLTIIDGAIGEQDAPAWTNLQSPNWAA
jgi:hypothetical protein